MDIATWIKDNWADIVKFFDEIWKFVKSIVLDEKKDA